MTTLKRALACAALGLLAGCDGGAPSTSNAGTPPPHNGSLVNLPTGGFVEVVKKPAAKGASAADEITFYFLKSMTTPMSPAPAAGTFTVGKGKVLTLVPKDGGLATPAGPSILVEGEPEGTLAVELDGKKTTIPIGVR